MMRTTQPNHTRGWNAVFKRLRLAFCQSRQRRGIDLGRLTHLGICAVINPVPLTVGNPKNHERGHRNIGVFLHACHNSRVTRSVALLPNTSVWSGIPLLTELRFGKCESKNSQMILL